MKYNKIKAAADYLKNLIGPFETNIGILTGTGMTGMDQIGNTKLSINYADIPNFPEPTVKSHAGILKVLEIEGKHILLFSGRFHFYEGYKSKEVCFPIYVMKLLGVQNLIMTNASGGLNESYSAGDVIVVSDHINLMGFNPLIGKNDDRLGIRFPDMSDAYSKDLRNMLNQIIGDGYKEGVYTSMLGPSLETPAEYKYINNIGGDMVGMSTVPEVIAATHAGMRTAVLSIISNMCYPVVESSRTTIEDVIANVQKSNPQVVKIIDQLCRLL